MDANLHQIDRFLLAALDELDIEQLARMPRHALATGKHKNRLAPKTLRPWYTLQNDLTPLWNHMRATLANVALPDPAHGLDNLDSIANEATLRHWLHRSVVDPAAKLINAFVSQDRELGATYSTNPRGRVVVPCFERRVEPRIDADVDLDRVQIEFRNNPIFDSLLRHLVHLRNPRPTAGSSPSDSPDSPPSPPRLSAEDLDNFVRHARANKIKTQSDFEFVCQLRHPDGRMATVADPEVTAHVCELKCPTALNRELLTSVLLRFGHHIHAAHRSALWQPDTLVIRLRQAVWGPDCEMSSEADGLCNAIIQIYTYMLTRRQSYGLLTSVNASLALRLDWSRPDEPGQHLEYMILAKERSYSFPCWDPDPAPFGGTSLLVVMVSLTILQMRTRQVEIDILKAALNDVQMVQEAYRLQHEPALHGGGGAGGADDPSHARSNVDDDDDSDYIDDDTDSNASDAGEGGRAPASDVLPFRLPSSVLASVACAETRREIERLFELASDPASCALARGIDLLGLCCAIWPCVSAGAPSRRQQGRMRLHVQDFRLMLPRALEFGPVPPAFNRRLALADALEQQNEQQLRQPGLGGGASDMSRSESEGTLDSHHAQHSALLVGTADADAISTAITASESGEARDDAAGRQQGRETASEQREAVLADPPPPYSFGLGYGGGGDQQRSVSASSTSSGSSDTSVPSLCTSISSSGSSTQVSSAASSSLEELSDTVRVGRKDLDQASELKAVTTTEDCGVPLLPYH